MNNEIAQKLTNRIITALENGTAPWRKPWTGAGYGPTSLSSGKEYKGINNLFLSVTADMENYEHNLWGTYKQVQDMGGSVSKGEKGTPIVLWKPITKEDDKGKESSFMIMRSFTVFNIGQTNVKVPSKYLIERKPVTISEALKEVMVYPGGPNLIHKKSDKAYYTASTDNITLPLPEQFESEEGYAGTVLHEIVHSTGHPSRLDRLESGSFGCKSYAQEELVAELGAYMLANKVGVQVEFDQTAAYVASWLKVLKDDHTMLIKAAQKAQKAVDVVLVS